MTSSERHRLEILFVDDWEDNYTAVSGRLKRAFRDLNCDPHLTFEGNFDRACETILTHALPFQVVIADLLRRPLDEPSTGPFDAPGLEVIAAAKHASAKTVIVALTDGDDTQPDLELWAMKAGAHIVLRRPKLLEARTGGPAGLAKSIYKVLGDFGVLQIGPALNHDEEPGVQSVIHEAGEPTIRMILADLLEGYASEPESARLTYVTPGASGAHVLGVDATLRNGSHRHLLVKIARDKQSLDRELHNANSAIGFYDESLVPYPRSKVRSQSHNGWSAIAMSYIDNAVTLRRWLTDPASAPWVPSVLGRLLLGLAHGFRNPINEELTEHPIKRLALEEHRRVMVRSAIASLTPALTHPAAAGLPDPQPLLSVVAAFARTGRLGAVVPTEIDCESLTILSHGDLHGGNILVSLDNPAPHIIDLANFGPHHWAFDLARLVVDITLRCIDPSVESFFWRRFNHWRALIAAVSQCDANISDPEPANEAAIAALRWIAGHRSEVIPPLDDLGRRWEWHTALAAQLLRGTYHVDLPPAKRTVALVAAYDQIVLAETTAPRPNQTY